MVDEIKVPTNFNVSVYGLTPYKDSPIISQARCRIFYKGANRNGTYITDEFAEKLLSTIDYTPIKGIFEDGDYTDHGDSRAEGRIYGVVPESHNFTWESHEDEDGVTREYACVDVLLFTGLYAEANAIVGKSQSMELYAPSIKGDWVFIDGKKVYQFEDARFLGLQALGDTVEPCFEGASFFTLFTELKELITKIESYDLMKAIEGGNSTMPAITFKISDSQKYDMLFNLLNPAYCEEGGWMISAVIGDIYDDYALIYNLEEGQYERAYYTKDDETDSLTVNKRKKCYILDVSEDEYAALKALRAMNGETYEKVDEVFSTKNEQISEYEAKIEEQNTQITTLNTECTDIKATYEALVSTSAEKEATLSALTAEVESLREYRYTVEKAQKLELINHYASKLDDEIISDFTSKVDDYKELDALEKDLAYALVKSTPEMFTKNSDPTPTLIPKVPEAQSGLNGYLQKYVK